MRSAQEERIARKPLAPSDVPGTANATIAAGLRANAKALEHPPAPMVGVPLLAPTGERFRGKCQRPTHHFGIKAHSGVVAHSRLMQSVRANAVSVNDLVESNHLRRGRESDVFNGAGCQTCCFGSCRS
jgi:hypothetical protein